MCSLPLILFSNLVTPKKRSLLSQKYDMTKHILFCLIFLSFGTIAQEKFTISGTISDSLKGEEIINASIRVKGQNVGTISNEYGFYSLTLPKGNYTLVYSNSGYSPKEIAFELNQSKAVNVQLVTLTNKTLLLVEVKVSATKEDQNITNPIMGVERLDPSSCCKNSGSFGRKRYYKILAIASWN